MLKLQVLSLLGKKKQNRLSSGKLATSFSTTWLLSLMMHKLHQAKSELSMKLTSSAICERSWPWTIYLSKQSQGRRPSRQSARACGRIGLAVWEMPPRSLECQSVSSQLLDSYDKASIFDHHVWCVGELITLIHMSTLYSTNYSISKPPTASQKLVHNWNGAAEARHNFDKNVKRIIIIVRHRFVRFPNLAEPIHLFCCHPLFSSICMAVTVFCEYSWFCKNNKTIIHRGAGFCRPYHTWRL